MRTRTSPAGGEPAHGGFTLIELLVVLAIIGLILVSIPGFLLRDNAAFNLDRSTQKLAESLRGARSVAITANREQTLSIDVERRQFLTPKAKAPVQLPAGVTIGFITARQEQLNETTGQIRFFPDGSSTGGRVILAVGDLRNAIEIDWLTGLISIIDAPS
ncbi:MAG: GspH/FimT family pseudopilin [Pseudomonadota bacterium]